MGPRYIVAWFRRGWFGFVWPNFVLRHTEAEARNTYELLIEKHGNKITAAYGPASSVFNSQMPD